MSDNPPIVRHYAGMVHIKFEGTLHDYETGIVTDPDEIARFREAQAVEIERERLAEERIRIANETGVIKFSSGRTMEPNAGIVGLSPELEVYEGFDSAVLDCPNDPPLPNDLSELADIMIDRWQRFKASLGEKA